MTIGPTSVLKFSGIRSSEKRKGVATL